MGSWILKLIALREASLLLWALVLLPLCLSALLWALVTVLSLSWDWAFSANLVGLALLELAPFGVELKALLKSGPLGSRDWLILG